MRVLTVVILYILLYLGLMIPIIILLAATLGNQLENPALLRILDLVLGLGGRNPRPNSTKFTLAYLRISNDAN